MKTYTIEQVARLFQIDVDEAAEIAEDLGDPITEESIERFVEVNSEPPVGPFDHCSVYFVEAEGTGLIKIGRSGNFWERLKGLTTMSPVPLKVLAVIPYGSGALEQHLHNVFAADRAHGEWFRATPELRRFIERRSSVYGPERWPWDTVSYLEMYEDHPALGL